METGTVIVGLQQKLCIDPSRPLRIAPEYLLIPIEEGVLVDGGPHTKLLQEPLSLTVLPLLLPFLDGRLSQRDIVGRLTHVPERQVQALLQMLFDEGVLIYVEEEEVSHSLALQNTVSFMKRADVVHESKAAAFIAEHSEVFLLYEGSNAFLQLALKVMHDNGFRHVRLLTRAESTQMDGLAHSLLISVLERGEGQSAASEHYSWLRRHYGEWLRVVLDSESGTTEVGPLVTPEVPLCQTCMISYFFVEARSTRTQSASEELALAAAIVTEVTSLVIGSPKRRSRAFCTIDVARYETAISTWPIAGACSRCGTNQRIACEPLAKTSASAVAQSWTPVVYEDAIANRDFDRDPSAGLVRTFPANKMFLNSPAIHLPEVKRPLLQPVVDLLLSSSEGRQKSKVSMEELGSLLALSVGFRNTNDKVIRRWAPSGGNLGSAEAYVLVNNVEGLRPGVYFYLAPKHALVQLNQRNVDHLGDALRAVDRGRNPAAYLVLTGAYARIAIKYGAFAYKLLHLDIGVASSQAGLVATALGLPLACEAEWNPGTLSKALALRQQDEVPAQVLSLAPQSTPRHPVEANASPSSGVPDDDRRGFLKQTEALHCAALMMRSRRMIQDRLPSDIKPSAHASLLKLTRRLSGVRHSEKTLGATLNTRQSVRQFSNQQPRADDLRTVLTSALSICCSIHENLTINVIVQNTAGLASGVYVFDASTSHLRREIDLPSRGAISALFFETHYADAPWIFWISGDVRRASQQLNGGYQSLLLRAGQLSHRLWIGSVALGLSGVLVAGISSDATGLHPSPESPRTTSLVAFVCGYSVEKGTVELRDE